MPGRVEAATIDHGLRPQSAEEAAFVSGLCREIAVPHRTIAVTVEPGNLQANARRARYSALAKWYDQRGLAVLATAHHADDQAETLLMRLNRGSGLSGLAGVRAHSWFLPASAAGEYELVRPLLDWRKAELAALVDDAGVEAVTDPSNEDEAFDRVRIRKALAKQDWLDPVAIAKSASLLGDVQVFVEAAVIGVWQAYAGGTGDRRWYYPGDDRLENTEIAVLVLDQIGSGARKSDVARLVDRLARGQSSNLGGILAKPVNDKAGLGRNGWRWDFMPEPQRKTG